MEFVEVPACQILFGRIDDESGLVETEGLQISLSTFQIMTTEVTQQMWDHVTGTGSAALLAAEGVGSVGPGLPMVCVSIIDCQLFVDSLNALDDGFEYRLPSSAQWECAYRAGSEGRPYHWGWDSTGVISSFCWYSGNSGGAAHDAATLLPNNWGLYDMCGNVWEWCLFAGTRTGADGISSVDCVALRGGSFASSAADCRIDRQLGTDSTSVFTDCGFRVIRRTRPAPPPAPFDPSEEHGFGVFAEPGLAIGGISHDFWRDEIEQFGYNFERGCEQDAAYLRIGAGGHFGRFATFLYGELGSINPGGIFDNHGPYILPEILLYMREISVGIELRYSYFKARAGIGSYSGFARIDEENPGGAPLPPGSWDTGISEGHGFHYAVGAGRAIDETFSLGLEWVQHFITLTLNRSGTGVEPSEHEARHSEVRIFLNAHMLLDPLEWF